jgi:iron complex outermembrane recepter protein
VTLDYNINRDAMIYASYSRGFKSGGFQWLATDPFIASQIFNPERVDAFEAGFKTQWFNRALTVNGSIFTYDYQNLQVLRIVPTPGGSASSLISNAASSRVNGAELEIALAPVEGLDINFGYTYLDAKYKDYVFSGIAGQPALDFSGSPLVRAPRHTLNAGIQYAIPVGDQQTFTLRGDWSYTSSFWHEPGRGLANPLTAPLTREPGYSVVNFRATYETGPWRISAFVNNAFNEFYRQSALTNPPIILPNAAVGIPTPGNFVANPGQVIGYPAPPRMYGVSIGFRFN